MDSFLISFFIFLLILICFCFAAYHLMRLILIEKDKTINFIVRAEVGEAKATIYREVSSVFGGLHERTLTAWIEQGGTNTNTVTQSHIPYPIAQNALNSGNSEDGRTVGRIEIDSFLENKPIQWVIPEKLKGMGRITSNDEFVSIYEPGPDGERKHSVLIPTKESGLIPFFKNYYVGACLNRNCVDKFFTTENHAKFCSEKCRKDENRQKGK
jgi:hypothetical protein